MGRESCSCRGDISRRRDGRVLQSLVVEGVRKGVPLSLKMRKEDTYITRDIICVMVSVLSVQIAV